jgi:iron complex outermembrane receptor protein
MYLWNRSGFKGRGQMNQSIRAFSRIKSFLLAAISILLAAPAVAQQGDQDLLEEIVVTATKRAEAIQDVPIAINALAGEHLEAMGIFDTDDIVDLYPNLFLQGPSALNTGFSIRGVGTNNYHITGQQAVGQYVDEVTLVSPFTSQFAVFDMERIEILRGPQNTLFGRNTTGGAVNYITRKPIIGEGVSGRVRLSAGNEGRLDFEGALNAPLGDKAALRVAVNSVNRDAIWDNLYVDPVTGPAPDRGEIERNSGRVHLLFEPSEDTSLLFTIHAGYNRGDRGASARASGLWDAAGPQNVNTDQGVMSYVDARAAGATIISPVIDCPEYPAGIAQFEGSNSCVGVIPRSGGAVSNPSTTGWNQIYDAGPALAEVDLEGFVANISHDFGGFELSSVTAYDELAIEFPNSNALSPHGTGFVPGQSGTWEIFSQELRLVSDSEGRIRWIAGAFYNTEDDSLATIIYRTDDGAPPFGVVPSIAIDQDVTIWSLYGQVETDVGDRGTFTIGLRYTDDSKSGNSVARVAAYTDTGTPGGTPFPLDTYMSLDFYNQLTDPPSGPCPPPVGGFPCRLDIPVVQDLEEPGWNLIYDHRFTDDFMGYVSYSKGFKSGAFDTRALAAFSGTADRPVLPEFMYAYEAGFKSTLADGQVIFNGAVFFYDWEDLQVFDVDETGAPAFLNVPQTEIFGIDLELQWVPAESWYIQAGLGYLDTEITDDGGLTTVTAGSVLTNAPELSFNALVQKEFQIGGNSLMLQADVAYRDKFNASLNEAPMSWVDSVTFLNARASYNFGSEQQYEIAVWADNITEEVSCSAIDTLGTLSYVMECSNPVPEIAFYGITFAAGF